MVLIWQSGAWCIPGDVTMVAGLRTSIVDRVGVGIFAAVCLSFVSVANAQIQRDVDRCTGKDNAAPDLQISGCTAVIGANTYAGKELAFAFNNRGLARYARREFDRAIEDYSEAIRLDPNFARGYSNRALVHEARSDFDRAIADYNQAIGLDPKGRWVSGN
jgi:tetratricopeptide (TPR) repeat protein